MSQGLGFIFGDEFCGKVLKYVWSMQFISGKTGEMIKEK